MSIFDAIGGGVQWIARSAQQTLDRLTGVEAERQRAKTETKRLKKELARVKQHIQTSKAKRPQAPIQAALQAATTNDVLAGRSFATKKGMRRVPYAFEGRFLELELDLSTLEKDIASDLKSLREAVDQARKEEAQKLQELLQGFETRLKSMEDAGEQATQAQEETLTQVTKELGELRSYAQALDMEKGKRQEQMDLLRGPMLGVLQNVVSALNATEAPTNPVGVWVSEGLEAYTRLGSDVPEDMRQWMEIASLVSRAWAYYDPQVGLESIITSSARTNGVSVDASVLEELKQMAARQKALEEELRRRLPPAPGPNP